MTQVKQFQFNDKQLEVINAFKKGSNRLFLEGGVRSGKSVVCAYLIDWICSRTPGMEAYVYRDTYESIRKDTHRILKDNPGWLNGKGQWKEGSKEFHYSNGSKIFFQYTKGGKHTLGQTAGLIFFEQVESIREEDYDLILPRLSQWGPQAQLNYMTQWGRYVKAGKLIKPRNYLLLSANPKAGWVKSRYIDTEGMPDTQKEGKTLIQDNIKKENITRFHLSTYDNIQNLGEEYLRSMETASEDFKKRYYDGSWEMNTGLIYPEFKDDDFESGGNVVNFEWEIANDFNPKNLRTFVAIDPGYVKSKFAALFCAILSDNTYYIFDELVRNGKGVEEWDKIGPKEFAQLLKDKYRERGFEPSKTIIDPAAHNENSGMGSVSGLLARHGIVATSALKTKESGSIFAIKDLFKGKRIIVNVRCQAFLKELGLFRWDERKQAGEQKPLDEDNDLCDCLRYIINTSPHPLQNVQNYKDIMAKNYGPDMLYKNWLKSWYGAKQKKTNILAIDNKNRKQSWGI